MHAPLPWILPPELLLLAYREGVFPMADSREDAALSWIEPQRRGIIPIGGFHCSRSLARVLRQDRFTVTIDTAFERVVAACAAPRPLHPESWISERIAASYANLHRAGHAHSIECWQDGALVGGTYGVAFDRVFCGESMFSTVRDASKVALAWALSLLERAGCVLFDCQFLTDHLASLGAVEIPQREYKARLARARGAQPQSLPQAYAALLAEADGAGDGLASSPGKLIAQSLTQTS